MRFGLLLALAAPVFLLSCGQGRLPQLPSANGGKSDLPGDANAETFMRMGDNLFAKREFAGASAMFKRAITLDPMNATGYARLGDLAWASGELNSAAQLYSTALQLDQSNPDALLGRSRALALAGENDASMLLVNDLIRTHGASYQALGLKAMLFDLEGQHDEAQTLLATALERSPSDASLLTSFAYSNALEGEYRAAVDILRGLGEQQATAAVGQYALADIYALSGQTGAAKELRRAAAGGRDVSDADVVFLNRLAGLSPTDKARALYFRQLPVRQPQPQPQPTALPQDQPIEQQVAAIAPQNAPRPAQMPQSAVNAVTPAGTYWVQIASFQSRSALELAWYQIKRATPQISRQLTPSVETVEIADKGTFHRLYAGGFEDRPAADQVCAALRSADLGCVIVEGTRQTMSLAQALAKQ